MCVASRKQCALNESLDPPFLLPLPPLYPYRMRWKNRSKLQPEKNSFRQPTFEKCDTTLYVFTRNEVK